MEQIQNLIPPIPDAAPSYDDLLSMQTDAYNAASGSLTGFQCDLCRNKGMVAGIRDGEMYMSECRCMKTRRTLRCIRESGLEEQLRECKFSSFETTEPWQQKMKSAAMAFVQNDALGFFISGQSGSGKTHICTAIVGGMIKRGLSARYFVWREDSTILKALINDPEYTDLMQTYKKTDCLYIDDLFKGGATDADKKLAFELIDYRYRNRLKTIISTELTESALIKEDEALTGRILQMSRGFRMEIPKDPSKNYRLR